MATEDARKLFMAGLPDSVTEEALRGLFTETGAQVTELTLPRDRATGRPRGFAFVRLGSEAEAERARQDLDGRILDGKMISVRPFHADPPTGRAERGPGGPREGGPGMGGGDRGYGDRGDRGGDRGPRPMGGDRGPRPGGPGGDRGPGGGGGPGREPPAPDRTLYVGNLPYDASQEDIDNLLKNAGAEAPARVYLPLDADGRKRGFGFVTMNSADAANAALEALKGADMRGRRLVINIAHPKGDRPERGAPGGGPGGGPGGDRPYADRPPRVFSGPPGGGFAGGPVAGGPGGPPPSRANKGEGRRRKYEDGGERGRRRQDEDNDNWRNRDDWDE